MQEVFSKIIEKLEENQTIVFNLGGGKPKQSIDLERAIEIVKQEAEKFGTDTNVGSNGWIPCSERLPEENSNVIACFAHGLVTELAFYDGLFHGIYEYTTSVIIAWQPLPAPYQPKGEIDG